MADAAAGGGPSELAGEAGGGCGMTRKEKRKAMKKLKRKQLRKEVAIREREEEEARSNDPEEQLRIRLREQEEAEIAERERKAFEERESLWLEAAAARKAAEEEEEEEARREKLLEESREKENQQKEHADELEEGDEWEYVEEGPAEIIWQGNEIIVKKKRVRVAKKSADRQPMKEDDDRPTSNPLPPQSAAFASYKNEPSMSAQEVLEKAALQIPNFGTEQDKAHCPFHLKTGACRFGSRCSRVHFHPDKSCTLLVKNMYSGPGLAWEQDEGLEFTDEEVECCYEEFYEDVHTEFLKFGELVNFKVCRNGSHHLRGNVYVHYKTLDSALLAYSNMNGRYYAGKQIMFEFVAITRWKVAICGEYMKSGLKTCSHGTACNFIHCFRNPGGDYEWADWDNPPPKYWIRKMSALFGDPESAYDKQMELEDHEKSRDSKRKKTPTKNRYHSRRSIDGETDVRDSVSIREDPGIKRDQYSRHSIRREHSYRRRKEIAFLDKHEQSEENNKSEVRYCSPSHDSGEDIPKTRDGDFLERHWKYEEKNSVDDRYKRKHQTTEDLSRKKGKRTYSIGRSKPEKHHKSKSHKKEHGSSDWHSGDDNNKRVPSVRPSSDKSGAVLKIDEERYNGGYSSECSDDFGSTRDSSIYRTKKEHHLSEKREYDRYNSQHHKSHKSYYYKSDGENSKMRKQRTESQKDSFNDSSDDWRSTGTNSDHEDTDDHLPSNSSRPYRKHGRSGRKRKHRPGRDSSNDSADDRRSTGTNSDHEDADDHLPSNSSRPYRKHGRSGRKRKHHPGKDEYRKYDEEISNSDSDSPELTRRAYKKHSRSRTPIQ
ncbi:uncharacterized protein [Elaeis guineensis]|uniref:Zinc finger CCCH domain-containing protein 16 isoform X2 n=1 Tax=Elaeis guineensis var. tenera TaxID=51953 RepID=A0A6J0PFI0_ELAGV|nr:zinc finger CCCH domain-containing protein 16 isoform X2 [Elaeis guineensis]